LLHRDVKPHNILITRETIKLMDFGIARELEESQAHLTQTGQLVGSLPYMPPEMVLPDPQNPVSEKADVYMLGVLLQELLTRHPSASLSKRADCPPAWKKLRDEARASDPTDRPSVREFGERLKNPTPQPTPLKGEGEKETRPQGASRPPQAAPLP